MFCRTAKNLMKFISKKNRWESGQLPSVFLIIFLHFRQPTLCSQTQTEDLPIVLCANFTMIHFLKQARQLLFSRSPWPKTLEHTPEVQHTQHTSRKLLKSWRVSVKLGIHLHKPSTPRKQLPSILPQLCRSKKESSVCRWK